MFYFCRVKYTFEIMHCNVHTDSLSTSNMDFVVEYNIGK